MSVTLDALQKVPFLSHVPRKQLDGLAQTMSEREISAGKDVVTQGSGGVAFFLILEGTATVIVDGELALREVRSGRAEIVQTWGRPESVRQEFRRIRAQ